MQLNLKENEIKYSIDNQSSSYFHTTLNRFSKYNSEWLLNLAVTAIEKIEPKFLYVGGGDLGHNIETEFMYCDTAYYFCLDSDKPWKVIPLES